MRFIIVTIQQAGTVTVHGYSNEIIDWLGSFRLDFIEIGQHNVAVVMISL